MIKTVEHRKFNNTNKVSPEAPIEKCLNSGAFHRAFSYLDPTTPAGAQSVLAFACATKSCRAAADTTRLYPAGAAMAVESKMLDKDPTIQGYGGRVPNLSVLDESRLTAERSHISKQNPLIEQPCTFTSGGPPVRFQGAKTTFPMRSAYLQQAQVVYVKELDSPHDPSQARKKGKISLTVRHDSTEPMTSNPRKLLQKNIFASVVRSLRATTSQEPDKHALSNWRKRKYAEMVLEDSVPPTGTKYRIDIIGENAVPERLLTQQIAQLVYAGVIPERIAAAILQEVSTIRNDS